MAISANLGQDTDHNSQRLFLIATFLDLIQVPKGLVAQIEIGHSALICVVHPLANHWNAYKTPVV